MTENFINAPTSDEEMARRGTAIREQMLSDGVDVLIMQSASDDLGGYLKYVTDLPAGGYGITVILPVDDDMTVIMHGDLDGDASLPPGGTPLLRGVKRILTAPYFPTIGFTDGASAALALKVLDGYRSARIGLVGVAQMSLEFGEQIKSALPTAKFINATNTVDRVKVIKSEEEQTLVRAAASLQDATLAAVFAAAAPGMRESELSAIGKRVGSDLGSEAGIVMIGSGAPGGGWGLHPRHMQNRILDDGDMIAVLVEINGPGGMFAELGRSAILGAVPDAIEDEYALALEAQKLTLDRLVPGSAFSEVWAEYAEFLRRNGRPAEKRIHCHGQGADLVERPLARFDETMIVQSGMNLTCHPTWIHNGIFAWTCDNYLVGHSGVGASVHQTPSGIRSL